MQDPPARRVAALVPRSSLDDGGQTTLGMPLSSACPVGKIARNAAHSTFSTGCQPMKAAVGLADDGQVLIPADVLPSDGGAGDKDWLGRGLFLAVLESNLPFFPPPPMLPSLGNSAPAWFPLSPTLFLPKESRFLTEETP